MLQAEGLQRDRAITEQVIADDAAAALADLPSGFVCRQRCLGPAVGHHAPLQPRRRLPAGTAHARATTATTRASLINIPAGWSAPPAGSPTLHLPEHWPWQPAWQALQAAVCPTSRQHAT
jgi:hypothetical protein